MTARHHPSRFPLPVFERWGLVAILVTFLLGGAFAQAPSGKPDSLVVVQTDSLETMGDEAALRVIRKALTQGSSGRERARLHYLAGRYFARLARYDSGLVYLDKASSEFTALNDTTGIANSSFEKAGILSLKTKYKEAIPLLQKSLSLFQSVKNPEGATRSLLQLGYSSYKLKRYPEAKTFYTRALDVARRTEHYQHMVAAYDGLATTYEAMKDYRNAIASVRFMQGAYDTIAIRNHRRQLKELESRYSRQLEAKDSALVNTESQHRQVQSDRLLRLIERDDIRLTFTLALLAMTFIVLVILVVWLVTRHRARTAERKLERELAGIRRSNEEFETISKQVNEELAHSLNEFSFSTGGTPSSPSTLKSHGEAVVRNTMDLMWLINPSNRMLESVVAFIRERANQLLKSSGVNFMIVVPDRIPTLELSTLERVNLCSVTFDLLNYSVHSSKVTGLTLSMTMEGKQLIFRIKESNGPVTEEKIQRRADALKPYREKMEAIDGTIGVINEGGAVVIIYRKDLYR